MYTTFGNFGWSGFRKNMKEHKQIDSGFTKNKALHCDLDGKNTIARFEVEFEDYFDELNYNAVFGKFKEQIAKFDNSVTKYKETFVELRFEGENAVSNFGEEEA